MSESTAPVLLTLDDGVAHIQFNSPKTLNAIDSRMARAFREIVIKQLASSDVRAVLLTGEGRAFMAGGNLQDFLDDLPNAPQTACQIIDPLHEALAALAEGDAPVIAAVHGAVAGAGLSLALGSDLVVAAESTRFVPAYARIGACQDGGGSWALPRLVGMHKAMEMMLLAEPFDAQQALGLGIVNRVVPDADLGRESLALARQLATGPTKAYGQIRRQLRGSMCRSLEEQLRREREGFTACAATRDFAEGTTAFFQKRAARFVGS